MTAPAPLDFDDFVRAQRPALLRTARMLVPDAGRAEDLVQEALIRLAQHWTAATRDGTPLAYARTILTRRAIDEHRWRQRRPEATGAPALLTGLADGDLHPGRPHPSDRTDPTAASDLRVVLRDALAQLTPKQRAVLVLRFLDDLTEVQTAQALGVSQSTVKSQCRVALERLRQIAPELAPLTAGVDA